MRIIGNILKLYESRIAYSRKIILEAIIDWGIETIALAGQGSIPVIGINCRYKR